MRLLKVVFAAFWCLGCVIHAQDFGDRARQLEASADSLGARSLLEQAVREQPQNLEYLTSYAEFLDRHNDPRAREVYGRLLGRLSATGGARARAGVARRLVILDLLAGDPDAASGHLKQYRAAGGDDLASASVPRPPEADQKAQHYVEIPGPLGSFARMAAFSAEAEPENVLAAIARNVVTSGYRTLSGGEGMEPTEFLKLAIRYLSQARELERLADDSRMIRIETCESPKTADLLRVLGYRMRGACGTEVILETVNATRAFLTIDSGFPLAELEQSLRTSRPFICDFRPSRLPIPYGSEYWLSARRRGRDETFIDAFLGDPSLCRLYLGLSKLSPETAAAVRQAADLQRLRAFAHVLDFFGALFEVRDGRALLPGGARSAAMWEELVGVSPEQGGEFFVTLIAKDDGWMASYFDSLMRMHGPARDYLTEPERMKRFYMAIRGRVTSPGPARPVFRSNADLMLLATRLRLEKDGLPHIPGNLQMWIDLFVDHPDKDYDRKLRKLAPGWDHPDDVLEALFGLCRKPVGNEPLRIYLALSDMNRERSAPLKPATADRLARSYHTYGEQYAIFTESASISDETIVTYLDKAEQIDRIGNRLLRSDTAGTMQALTGLWQIFVRNGSIPPSGADAALWEIIRRFGRFRNQQELYESASAGVKALLHATGAPENVSPQDRFIDLLAGAVDPDDTESHRQIIEEMIRLYEAQKLVALDTIFDLASHLEGLAAGREQLNTALVNRVASRLSELRLPREGLSSAERGSVAFGFWPEQHIQAQRKLRLRSEISRKIGSPEDLLALRGRLAPMLRDTLVGFNYMHYAPPGGQVLRTNPVFVRGHDFLGMPGANRTWEYTEVLGVGWPSSVGGRLVGSLSGLPYALAEAEQNFLIPDREQALIWTDLVPQMMLNAKVPRWWNITPGQMHWVALHLRYGESALAEAALVADHRELVLESLARLATPGRVSRVGELLATGNVARALEFVTPSELFVLAADVLGRGAEPADPLSTEIRRLAAEDPDRVNYQAISRAFGSPKPMLATSYRPELLNLRTFPTLMGYSSRIMAESWESNVLYYAALADELLLRPSQLNVVVPEWTRMTVEAIFATHLEDWPAVLRSLRAVGDHIRTELRQGAASTQQASLQ